MIKDITTSFDELKLQSGKLTEILHASGRSTDTRADIVTETSTFHELSLQLNQYDSIKSWALKVSSAKEGKYDLSSETSHAVARALPLKVEKPEAVKFSGNSRDFASFRRDCMAIIVPNRGDAEIGLHFKQGIPNQ